MAPLVRTGGSRHTGLAAPPHRNIQVMQKKIKISHNLEILLPVYEYYTSKTKINNVGIIPDIVVNDKLMDDWVKKI